MENVVAFCVVQESVEEAPEVIEVGFKDNVHAGGGTTVAVAEHCTLPPGPVAVPVYVVVAAGVWLMEPLLTDDWAPMP